MCILKKPVKTNVNKWYNTLEYLPEVNKEVVVVLIGSTKEYIGMRPELCDLRTWLIKDDLFGFFYYNHNVIKWRYKDYE